MIQNQNQIRLQNRPNYVVPCHTEQEPEVFIENQVRNITWFLSPSPNSHVPMNFWTHQKEVLEQILNQGSKAVINSFIKIFVCLAVQDHSSCSPPRQEYPRDGGAGQQACS